MDFHPKQDKVHKQFISQCDKEESPLNSPEAGHRGKQEGHWKARQKKTELQVYIQ